MNASTKTFLIATILGTLGLGGIVGTAYASESKPTVAISSQHRASSNDRTSEVSHGNGKTERATEHSERAKPLQTQETDENEVNEGPNDSDGGANEDSQ